MIFARETANYRPSLVIFAAALLYIFLRIVSLNVLRHRKQQACTDSSRRYRSGFMLLQTATQINIADRRFEVHVPNVLTRRTVRKTSWYQRWSHVLQERQLSVVYQARLYNVVAGNPWSLDGQFRCRGKTFNRLYCICCKPKTRHTG